MQYFTLINPLRYAIDIAQRVYLEGAGLDGCARTVAAGGDRRRHAAGGRVDVPPPARIICGSGESCRLAQAEDAYLPACRWAGLAALLF